MSRPRPGRLPRGVSGEREARLALRRKQSPHLLERRTVRRVAKSKHFGSSASAPGAAERDVPEVRRMEERGRRPRWAQNAPDFAANEPFGALVQRTGPLSQESAAEVVRDLAGFPRLVSGEREARLALRKNSLRIS